MGQYKTNRILKNWGSKNGEKHGENWDNMVLYGLKLVQYWDNDGIIIEYQWIYPLSSSVAGTSSHQMEICQVWRENHRAKFGFFPANHV